jgi:IS5 family transposase
LPSQQIVETVKKPHALMQKHSASTNKMVFMTEEEIFDKLVTKSNPFRKIKQLINFSELVEPLRELYSDLGNTGFDVEKGFKALVVQYWEDYSDREMENAVRENIGIRWFCGFGLTEETPDHTYFCKLRKRLGAKRMADTFNQVNEILKGYGLFGNVFTFIDASSIISKTHLWEERDKAIEDGAETLNNTNVEKYAADKEARWGAKSKSNIWFGYKRHESVDMRYGLINKVAVTPANVLDFEAIGGLLPKQGMVFVDKLYDCKSADRQIKGSGCYAATIRKNNNKTKNRDLDKWRSKVRMPFEGVFSKQKKKARYRGRVKVFMQCVLEALCHNLKKAVTILPQPSMIPITA